MEEKLDKLSNEELESLVFRAKNIIRDRRKLPKPARQSLFDKRFYITPPTKRPAKKNEQDRLRYFSLYVLALEGGKYYVGITARTVEKRFAKHLKGTGSAWTKLHKPLRIIESEMLGEMRESEATKHETRKTLEVMKIHGIENVRGGPMCQVGDVSARCYHHAFKRTERYFANKAKGTVVLC